MKVIFKYCVVFTTERSKLLFSQTRGTRSDRYFIFIRSVTGLAGEPSARFHAEGRSKYRIYRPTSSQCKRRDAELHFRSGIPRHPPCVQTGVLSFTTYLGLGSQLPQLQRTLGRGRVSHLTKGAHQELSKTSPDGSQCMMSDDPVDISPKTLCTRPYLPFVSARSWIRSYHNG